MVTLNQDMVPEASNACTDDLNDLYSVYYGKKRYYFGATLLIKLQRNEHTRLMWMVMMMPESTPNPLVMTNLWIK